MWLLLGGQNSAPGFFEAVKIRNLLACKKIMWSNPDSQDLRWDQRERREGADLDSIDRDAHAEFSSDESEVELEPVESGGAASAQSVDVPRSVGVAQCAIPDAGCWAGWSTTRSVGLISWTAFSETSKWNRQKVVQNVVLALISEESASKSHLFWATLPCLFDLEINR